MKDICTSLAQCVPCIIIYEDNRGTGVLGSLDVVTEPEKDPGVLIQRPTTLFPPDFSRTPGSQETGIKMQIPTLEPSSQPPHFPVTSESSC